MDQSRLCKPVDLRRLCKIAEENDLPMRVLPERLAILRDDCPVVLLPYPRTEQAYIRNLCLFGMQTTPVHGDTDIIDVLLEDFLDLPTIEEVSNRDHPFHHLDSPA